MNSKFSVLPFCVLILLTLGLSSCKNAGPKETAEKYLNGFAHLDFEAAKSVSTEETKKTLAMMEQLAKKMVSDSIRKERMRIKIDIEEAKETDKDHAEVTYTTSESSALQKIYLIKQNGKWLVDLNKVDQFELDKKRAESPAPTDETNTDTTRTAIEVE